MAATAATRTTHNSGDQMKYVYTFAAGQISDAQTFDTGLGGRIQDMQYLYTADPTTNSAAAMSIANSAGTLTFYPGQPNIAGTLTVYATGA
jgi:hypothetical protein